MSGAGKLEVGQIILSPQWTRYILVKIGGLGQEGLQDPITKQTHPCSWAKLVEAGWVMEAELDKLKKQEKPSGPATLPPKPLRVKLHVPLNGLPEDRHEACVLMVVKQFIESCEDNEARFYEDIVSFQHGGGVHKFNGTSVECRFTVPHEIAKGMVSELAQRVLRITDNPFVYYQFDDDGRVQVRKESARGEASKPS